MKRLILLCFIFFGALLNAQEICDNGIDDDADGLIDILDEECDCIPTGIITISADFEAYLECPTGLSFSGSGDSNGYYLIDTSIEWDIASLGTPDYFNTCDYLGGDGQVPFVPLPIPSGDGAMGMISRPGGNYVEGISECLDCRMVPGETYNVQFYAGFNDDVGSFVVNPVRSSSPVEFALLGRVDCNNIPYNGTNSLLPSTGWEEIATFTVEGELGEWVFVSGSFVAQEAYVGLAFYKSIAFVTSSIGDIDEYHFMDDLQITGLFKGQGCGIPQPPEVKVNIVSTGDCLSSFNLVAEADDAISYQWYLDGNALTGETNASLNNLTQVGNYKVRVIFSDGDCTVSESLDFQSAIINVAETNTISSCFGDATGEIALEVNGLNPPFSYEWSNGETTSSVEALAAGVYEVTITDSLRCERIDEISVQSYDEIITITNVRNPDCAGEEGSIQVIFYLPNSQVDFNWSDGTIGQSFISALAGDYAYTITNNNNGCTLEGLETIVAPDSLGLIILSQQNPANNQTDGFITVEGSGGIAPYEYQWSTGNLGPNLSNVGAGTYQITLTDVNDCSTVFEIILDELGALGVDFNIENNICPEDCNAQISLSISGGEMPYTVAWSNGQTDLIASDLCSGSYSATIMDNEGQSITIPEIEVLPLPLLGLETVALQNPANNQTDGFITVEGSGGMAPYEYQWSTGNLGPSLENIGTGIYQVTLTDANDCSTVLEVNLEELEALSTDFNIENNICPENCDGQIALSITGGEMPYDVIWSNGQTGPVAGDLCAGAYTATITDNRGQLITTSPLEIKPLSVLELDVVALQNPANNQTDGFITVEGSGGMAPYEYQWSTGNLGPSLLNVGTGIYQVTLTDANDCSTILEVNLEELEALSTDFNIENNICPENCDGQITLSITGGEMPYDVIWSNGQTGPVAGDLCAGAYTATITDNRGQIITISDMEVVPLFILELDADISPVSCVSITDGQISVQPFGGSSPYSFDWSTGNSSTSTLVNLPAGNYSITIQDANSCLLIDSFFVQDYLPTEIDYTLQPMDCNYENYELDIVSSSPLASTLTYLLNGQIVDDNSVISVMDQNFQNYELAYLDTNNCLVPIGDFILNKGFPYEVFIDETRQVLSYGEVLNLELSVFPQDQLSYVNIEWSINNPYECNAEVGRNCLGVNITAQQNEFVEVVFQDSLGCEQTFTIPINVGLPESYIYIPNVFSPNDDGINNEFALFITDFVQSVEEIKFFDRWGGLVFEQSGGELQEWDGKIRGKTAPTGVYVYSIVLQLANGSQKQISGDVAIVR